MKILITGGAGFVGSNLALLFQEQNPQNSVVIFDNLRRRGSELNLPLFKKKGIEFVHGDIRVPEDLHSLGREFDLLIEASAEPSVNAGSDGNCSYLLQTNLTGTINCLEFARKHCGGLIFLSTSRVYSIPDLLKIPLEEQATRFDVDPSAKLPPGLSAAGISKDFSLSEHRSLYGATKLASELVIREFSEAYGLPAIINRASVIAGPGQWGKTDQGVFTLWVANHFFNKPLRYTGFGGSGKQVRDLLHPQDLFDLLSKQIPRISEFPGGVFNIGGGHRNSISMQELTTLCREVTGVKMEISQTTETTKVDIPYFVTDNSLAEETFSWQPTLTLNDIVKDIHRWLQKEGKQIETALY